MTDFKSLLENKPLLECKKEIEDQFSSVMHHANEMKLAIIASFLLNGTMDVIREINPSKFLEKLKEELENIIKKADDLKIKQAMYMEHYEKNRELMTYFESNSNIEVIQTELEKLLKSYDSILCGLANERCKKSIAEIEAHL